MVTKEKAPKPERERLDNGEEGGGLSERTALREESSLKHFLTTYRSDPTSEAGKEQIQVVIQQQQVV